MNLVVALVLLLQDKSPEEVLQSITGKLDSAKTLNLKVSVEGASRGDGDTWSQSSWTLLMKDENKVRFTLNSRSSAGEQEALYVSDGKTTRVVFKRSGAPTTSSKETPRNLVPSLKEAILRGGPDLLFVLLFITDNLQPEKQTGSISNLKLSSAQKESHVLEYKFIPATPWTEYIGKVESTEVMLTYDPKTFQPIKRYIHSKREEKHKGVRTCPPIYPDVESWTTEAFDALTLNADIPDEKFKLPEK
jgi:outer membrane lipoprotein-sorting protein